MGLFFINLKNNPYLYSHENTTSHPTNLERTG